jgi:hypothetical protein
MKAEFNPLFLRLRALLEPYATRLPVTTDAADHYCLSATLDPKFKKPGPIPVAWVRINKAYVSFHLMTIYMNPALQKALSKKLKARMQGKSCFNFKAIDEDLFAELARVTEAGFSEARTAGMLK